MRHDMAVIRTNVVDVGRRDKHRSAREIARTPEARERLLTVAFEGCE